MKTTTASLAIALLIVLATAVPTDLVKKRSEIPADRYLLGSGYKRDELSKKADADDYDLRSAWSKKDIVDADDYDLRSAWSKKDIVDADDYDLRSAWSKRIASPSN